MTAKDNGDEEKGHYKFPDPFYCPITKKVMKDPVVVPNGDSYERTAIVESGDVPSDELYTNRALREIIEEALSLEGNSFRASMRRLDKSIRSGFSQLLEKSALPSSEYRPLAEAFYCPITSELVHDPVIDPDGNTYERQAVVHWIKANSTSPITRNELSVEKLYDNSALGDLIDLEKGRSDESIHPSIRRWKDQQPTAPEYDNDEDNGEPTQSTTNANQYPTTYAEIEARRQRNTAVRTCTVLAIIILVFVIFLYVPYLGWLIFALAIFSCKCDETDGS